MNYCKHAKPYRPLLRPICSIRYQIETAKLPIILFARRLNIYLVSENGDMQTKFSRSKTYKNTWISLFQKSKPNILNFRTLARTLDFNTISIRFTMIKIPRKILLRFLYISSLWISRISRSVWCQKTPVTYRP